MSKITNKDPMSILKEIKAEVKGVSPDSITFSNFRNEKGKIKSLQKEIYDNDEGFDIIGGGVNSCSYKDIPKKRQLKKKENLEEWGAFDFFIYAQKKYINKYGKAWDLNIGGSSLTINKIRDKFYSIFGFCCNLIMRDYIDYFFVHYLGNRVKEGGFYFSQMMDDKIMCEFYEGYNFPQRFEEYMSNEKQKKKEVNITEKEIKEAFLIGDTSLLSNYGIIIALNWLLKEKNMSTKESAKLIILACKNIYDKGMIGIVKKSTEFYSPYPSDLLFTNPQIIMDKIDKNIKINVEFNDNCKDKFKFLKRKDR